MPFWKKKEQIDPKTLEKIKQQQEQLTQRIDDAGEYAQDVTQDVKRQGTFQFRAFHFPEIAEMARSQIKQQEKDRMSLIRQKNTGEVEESIEETTLEQEEQEKTEQGMDPVFREAAVSLMGDVKSRGPDSKAYSEVLRCLNDISKLGPASKENYEMRFQTMAMLRRACEQYLNRMFIKRIGGRTEKIARLYMEVQERMDDLFEEAMAPDFQSQVENLPISELRGLADGAKNPEDKRSAMMELHLRTAVLGADNDTLGLIERTTEHIGPQLQQEIVKRRAALGTEESKRKEADPKAYKEEKEKKQKEAFLKQLENITDPAAIAEIMESLDEKEVEKKKQLEDRKTLLELIKNTKAEDVQALEEELGKHEKTELVYSLLSEKIDELKNGNIEDFKSRISSIFDSRILDGLLRMLDEAGERAKAVKAQKELIGSIGSADAEKLETLKKEHPEGGWALLLGAREKELKIQTLIAEERSKVLFNETTNQEIDAWRDFKASIADYTDHGILRSISDSIQNPSWKIAVQEQLAMLDLIEKADVKQLRMLRKLAFDREAVRNKIDDRIRGFGEDPEKPPVPEKLLQKEKEQKGTGDENGLKEVEQQVEEQQVEEEKVVQKEPQNMTEQQMQEQVKDLFQKNDKPGAFQIIKESPNIVKNLEDVRLLKEFLDWCPNNGITDKAEVFVAAAVRLAELTKKDKE